MKKSLIFFALAVIATDLYAQTILSYNIDSLRKVLLTDLADTSRIWALNNLGRNIVNTDTTLMLAEQAIMLARKIGFTKGEAEAYNNVGYWFTQKGNYPRALQNYLKAIQVAESVNFYPGMKRGFNNIAVVYWSLKDYGTSISYARKGRDLSIKARDGSTQVLSASSLSRSFLALHQTDSALKYAQECYEVASRLKDPLPLYIATARLGEINAAIGNQTLALEYLRLSLGYCKQDRRNFRIAGSHQVLAEAFEMARQRDSCLSHAEQAFLISQKDHLSEPLLSSSLLLSRLFEGANDKESLRYYKFALAAQDSLFSQENNRQISELNFSERLRQQEVETAKLEEAESRKHNLQYAAIVVGLIAFVIFSRVLSHSAIANEGLIRFLGVLALLIVFEFINLLIHPLLADITHHSPLWMLAILVCIGALLVPLHHKLEKWIIHRLIEKNKRIRLAAAKNVISALEGNKE
jgi:tetratricopeptide (TPR) repeat protein